MLYVKIGEFSNILRRIYRKSLEKYYLTLFDKVGVNCSIGSITFCHFKNVQLGNNVALGYNTLFLTSNAKIIINDNVMFGPNVSIITGDHRIDVIGKNMRDVINKIPENDQDVIIEEDVWVGSGVTILKGITIGKGSVIAAGSIVIKNVPPYSIVGGNPAKMIKQRFSEIQLKEHIEILNNNKGTNVS